jgi:hypothetical protein
VNRDDKPTNAVRPGAILRAMGASDEAFTPPEWAPPRGSTRRAPAGHATHAAPRIEVVRDGDKVVRILAHCRCGETIAIDCDYADAPAAGTQHRDPA